MLYVLSLMIKQHTVKILILEIEVWCKTQSKCTHCSYFEALIATVCSESPPCFRHYFLLCFESDTDLELNTVWQPPIVSNIRASHESLKANRVASGELKKCPQAAFICSKHKWRQHEFCLRD